MLNDIYFTCKYTYCFVYYNVCGFSVIKASRKTDLDVLQCVLCVCRSVQLVTHATGRI